jgi:endoglucanase
VIHLVKKLVEAHGPSGREKEIREIVLAEISELEVEVNVSPLGSVHALLNKGEGHRVMLAAHMDEIGLIVSHIDENGYARFHPIGGLNAQTLVGHRVHFQNGVIAVIGIEEPEKTTTMPSIEKLFLDFGTNSSANCPVSMGDMGSFQRPFHSIGKRWIAKSMDDRIGVAILIEVMRKLKKTPFEVQFAFTVQEEVGLRGARTSAFGLEPNVAIAVDVTRTGDTPKGTRMAVNLGDGPAIKVRDSGMLSDPRIVDWMVTTAEKSNIPYQLEVLEKGTTDAAAIQITRAGVPSGVVSIPCRYIHSPSEMVDPDDVENAVHLMVELLRSPVPFLD